MKVMKNIIIDEEVRHGKPVIEGTRITVEEVLGLLETGMEFNKIQEEYGLDQEDIKSVIRYVNSFMSGEEVNTYA